MLYTRARKACRLRARRLVISRIGDVEVQATQGAVLLTLALAAISTIRLGGRGGLLGAGLLLISLLLHEVGHLAMAQSLGVRVQAIGVCLKGAYLCRSKSQEPLFELLIAAAGPAANFLLFFWLRDGNSVAKWVALLNLVLALSNLLPIQSSDGLRIWISWRALQRTPNS
jgi:Zn-dependent protease